MIKYLVRKHCEATERCTVALGRVQDYFYGSAGKYLSRDFLPERVLLRAYGFNTHEEAKERLEGILKSIPAEESSGYWKITAEIVEINVEDKTDDRESSQSCSDKESSDDAV